jgi:hypothetical protein
MNLLAKAADADGQWSEMGDKEGAEEEWPAWKISPNDLTLKLEYAMLRVFNDLIDDFTKSIF